MSSDADTSPAIDMRHESPNIKQLRRSSNSTVKVEEFKGTDESYETYIPRLRREICDLYLKIKRCSKDTNITESQYIKQVENSEDRQERRMIQQLDPFIVLQYISSSIDVIINLKFEDIEKKIRTKEAEDDMFNGVEAVSLDSHRFTKDPKNSAVQDGPEFH